MEHLFLLKMSLRLGIILVLCFLLVEGQQISKDKCSEYREITIHRAAIIPLTVNPKPYHLERFDCSTSVDLIVGGEATKPGEFPHQALLGWTDQYGSGEIDFRCGGSLISDRFVLTAAHCFKRGRPNVVRLGANNLADEYEDVVDFGIESVIRHYLYRGDSSYHDIALIKLDKAVKFSKLIRPACLWPDLRINVTSVIATGFGKTESGGHKSDIMQKVSLDFLDKSECWTQYRKQTEKFKSGIVGGQLCIGSLEGGKDTCQGDSGGPVQMLTEPKGCTYHIVGITSFGGACGHGRSPAIYTSVPSYIEWIERNVWPTTN